MRIAIYARKSVFAENSDSVKNQERMAREYAALHFEGDHTFLLYMDEDYTGANTNRPGLKDFMRDVKAGIIDFLIVYQLDRLSRNVRDFSNIYAFMEDHSVGFVSVKENIDTSTPLGKAMMYVSVVFAQMERETISNRVADNMMGLAAAGWWFGGSAPRGYRRIKVTEFGKIHTTLELIPEEANEIRHLYDKFLELNASVQSFETYCKHNGIKALRGGYFSASQIYTILSSPFYTFATPEVWDYYKSRGCIMTDKRERWDGKTGIVIYGRTTERKGKHSKQPPNKWRVSVGRHIPFIPAEIWLATQSQFTHNSFSKKMVHPTTLLKGTIRCKCGCLMGLARRHRKDGLSTWYICPKADRQGKTVCNTSQIKAEIIDEKALSVFRQIEHDPKQIKKYFSELAAPSDKSAQLAKLAREISHTEERIKNLSEILSNNNESRAAKYMISEIEALDADLADKNKQMASLQAQSLLQVDIERQAREKQKEITKLIRNFEELTIDEKNEIAHKVLKECVWNGETLFLRL